MAVSAVFRAISLVKEGWEDNPREQQGGRGNVRSPIVTSQGLRCVRNLSRSRDFRLGDSKTGRSEAIQAAA